MAEISYSRIVAKDSDDVNAFVSLGHIALLSNRLVGARDILTEAVMRRPDDRSKMLLAETFYRLDDFRHSAPLFRAVGREAKALKLESFGEMVPYQTDGATTARLSFVQTDPLPLVQLSVNGNQDGYFLIDTGGSELILDAEFANSVGALKFGSESGTFAGGRRAGYEHGRIDSIELGGLILRNVPVLLMDTRRFSAVAKGRRVDGVIGTVLLYHFVAVLDYPGGELVLHRRQDSGALNHQAQDEGHIQIPFWMAGDHYIVARGSVNGSQPLLLYLDTGLAGGGFTCPQSTLAEAGITVERKTAVEGVGGGGAVEAFPFVVNSVRLGDALERDVEGLFGVFPQSLEFGQGFRIGGLLSHGFFRNYRTVFDFGSMVLHLRRES